MNGKQVLREDIKKYVLATAFEEFIALLLSFSYHGKELTSV
jgi:hypothetical protein